MTADHVVPIRLNRGRPMPTIPAVMKVGETVTYTSPDGEVKVTFPDADHSPFVVSVIRGNNPQQLVKSGQFRCKCFIKPPGAADFIGWDGEEGGGDHDIKPNQP